MITFKEFLSEGFRRRPRRPSVQEVFDNDVQDALWDELRKYKLLKGELILGCHTFHHWRNHLVDQRRTGNPAANVHKIKNPEDWVLVRFTVNTDRINLDAELLYRILPKQLQKVLEQFFGRVEPFADNHLDTSGNYGGCPHIYLRWHVWDPKWKE